MAGSGGFVGVKSLAKYVWNYLAATDRGVSANAVDGVALGAHAAGYVPGDTRRVDGVALASHVAGYFPADVAKVDGAAIGTHAAGMLPADVRDWLGSAPNALNSGNVPAYIAAALAGAVPAIKSINFYSGSISVAASFSGDKDVTITSVDPTKAVPLPARQTLGSSQPGSVGFGAPDTSNTTWAYTQIASSTVFRFKSVATDATPRTINYAFYIVEFY